MPAEVTHWMALVPFTWLIALHVTGHRRDAGWWWIAGAFAVSAAADSAAHRIDPWIVGAVYPIVQASVIAAVLVSGPRAFAFAGLLCAVALADALLTGKAGMRGYDWVLRTVAWLGLVYFIWDLPLHRLRLALLQAFGAGWLAWIALLVIPGPPNVVWGSPSWRVYQAVRLTSLLLFCWASWKPHPMLGVVA